MDEVEDTEKKMSRHLKIALIITCAAIVFAALYVGAILAYQGDTSSRMVLLVPKPPNTPNYMTLQVKTLSVDLNRGSMDMRVIFLPSNNLLNNDEELTQDLRFIATTTTGGVERLLPKGQFPSPTDVTIELSGTVSDYPWDLHQGGLAMEVSGPKVNGKNQYVPIQVKFSGDIPGIDINGKMDSKPEDPDQAVAILVRRSPVTKAVVIFSMVLLWVLTATVLTLVIAVMLGHKIEMVMFPFIGTILFSMVVFRNALPGSPPIGAMSDYLTSWGYALTVLALLALTVTWARRLPPRESRDSKA